MGWGEQQGPSAAHVAQRAFEHAARAVAQADPDELAEALDRLRETIAAVDSCNPAQPRPGAYC